MEPFVLRSEIQEGRLNVLARDTKRSLAHQGRLSRWAGEAKGYHACLDKMRVVHDKMWHHDDIGMRTDRLLFAMQGLIKSHSGHEYRASALSH